MSALPVTRILAVAVALLACAWFALGIREGHDANQATQDLSNAGRLTPAQASHLSGLLDHAGVLNPDRAIDVLRARLQNHSGRNVAAIATLMRVVRDEPSDIDAWQLMALVAGQVNPALSHAALARVHALAPHVPLP